eukprot:1379403-Prymnesium_polylepis.3
MRSPCCTTVLCPTSSFQQVHASVRGNHQIEAPDREGRAKPGGGCVTQWLPARGLWPMMRPGA